MRVIVEGLIGVGKSTFTKEFAKIHRLNPMYESVDDNPFLAKFYEEPLRWAYTLQMHFLYDRYSKHLPENIVLDRSIWGDLCFANILREDGTLSEEEYQSYLSHSKVLTGHVPKVDLCIHLNVPVHKAMDRINNRGRGFESSISEDYLVRLKKEIDLLPSFLPPDVKYMKIEWGDMSLSEIADYISTIDLGLRK